MSVITGKAIPALVPYLQISATTYEINPDLGIIQATVSANATWTLPAMSGLKNGAFLYVDNRTTHTITLAANGSDTVNGSSSFDVLPNNFVTLYTGAEWFANSYSTSSNPPPTGTDTAYGSGALDDIATGSNDSAFGYQALSAAVTTSNNSAFGAQSLELATGSSNTADGFQALGSLVAGNTNIGVGAQAGFALTGGSNNIYLGETGTGLAANLNESNVNRFGFFDSSVKTYVAGNTMIYHFSPTSFAGTMSAADIISGIASTAANFAIDTGANLEAAIFTNDTSVFGQTLFCQVINSGAADITISAGIGMVMIDAASIIPAHMTRTLCFVRQSAGIFNVY